MDISTTALLVEAGALAVKGLNERWSSKESKLAEVVDVYSERELSGEKDPFSEKRIGLINRAKKLHTQVLFELSHTELQIKSIDAIYDSIIEAYSVTRIADFDSIEFTLSMVEAYIKKHDDFLSRQETAKRRATLVSLIGIVVIIIFIVLAKPDFESSDMIPILGIPWAVLVWSFIGSMTAILYRFNFYTVERQDPFRWLFTRPVTGVVMGILLYLTVKVGLIAVNGEPTTNLGASEIIWIVAFIGGFSDQLADSVLRLLVGKFGGDSTINPLVQISENEDFDNLTRGNLFSRVRHSNKVNVAEKQPTESLLAPSEAELADEE